MATIKDIEQMLAIRQAEIFGETVDANVVWEEEPVRFKEFCEGQIYAGQFPLSSRQYYDIDQLIGDDPTNIFSPSRAYDMLVLVYGKGGGKDEAASRVALYVVYVLLCMANPQEYLLGVKSNSTLHLINVARKGKQAEKVFFKYFRSHLLGSRWFKDRYDIEYHRQWHSRVHRRNGVRGKIVAMDDGAIFPKNIECLSETTENESWEGYNPVFFVLDEISGFKSTAELRTGWAIFDTARSSTYSRATRHFRGLGMIISYPRQDEGDIILDLFRICSPETRMYGSLAYPWIAKGIHNYSGDMVVFCHPRLDAYFGIEGVGVEVPVELETEFTTAKNIDDSITKYLCIPPPTAGGWLEYPEMMASLVVPTMDNTNPRYRPRLFLTRNIIEYAQANDHDVRFLVKQFLGTTARTQYEKQIPRVAWYDGAQKHCDAVIAIGHLEQRVLLVNNAPTPVEVVVIDDELVWRPDPDVGLQVSLMNVEQWLTNILPNNVRLVAVGSDSWNSAQLEENLRRRKIAVEVHNIDRDDYELTKRQMYIGGIELIDGEAPGQFRNVINSGTGKPLKKPGFLQDAADAVCGVVRLLIGSDKRGHSRVGRRATMHTPVGISVGGQVPSPFSTGAGMGMPAMPTTLQARGSGISQIPVNIDRNAQSVGYNQRVPHSLLVK